MVPRVTEYCAIRQKFLNASRNCIAHKISLVKVPTRHPSKMDWEGPWVKGPMLSSIIIKLKRIVKWCWNISRNRTIFSLEYPSTRVHAVNSRRSIISAPRHPRNVVTVAAIARSEILIPPSLVTSSETKEDSMLNVSRWTSYITLWQIKLRIRINKMTS